MGHSNNKSSVNDVYNNDYLSQEKSPEQVWYCCHNYNCECVTGSCGPQGNQGATGTQGVQGIQGIQGGVGLIGMNGIPGPTGINGVQGIQGATGAKGQQGFQGATGPQGIQGVQGIQGIQGTIGSTGEDGIAGSPGINGEEGLQGSTGLQGIEGLTGSPGIQGATGLEGIPGSPGPQGIQGVQGIQGSMGSTGCDGTPGSKGATGPQGIQGSNGTTGPSGPTINSYVSAKLTSNRLSIPIGGIITFDTVNIIGTDLGYNSLTGLFSVNNPGVFVFMWSFAISPDPITFAVQIDITNYPGVVSIGSIGATTTRLTILSSSAIYLAAAGDSIGFTNQSNGPVSIVYANVPGSVGNLIIYRIA